jgi:hypothetical protein
MRSLARISACCALLVAFALPAAAQGSHVFQAEKDLEGFEAAGVSEFHDVYALAEFKASDGKTVDEAALADLRARWSKERARAEKRVAEIQADPRERWTWLFEKRLLKHPYFSKIAWTLERPEPGYVLVVQRPAKDDPDYVARLTSFYMPFVKKAVANFDEDIAQPSGLVRAAGRECVAFAVLASQGDVDNFTRFVQDPTGYSGGTAYDYQLQLAVTFEDPFASGISVVAQRSSLLYSLVKGLQHAYLAIPGNRPGSIWLYEGLAFLLATHDGATPDSLDRRPARPKSIEWLVELLGKQPAREIVLMPIDELVAQRSWIEFSKAIAARTKLAQADPPDEEDVGRAYFAQSELWLHFLFDGAKGAYRKPLADFIGAAFRGRGDEQDFKRAFGATDPRALSREFLGWVCDEYERTHPGKKVARAPIAELFGAHPGAAAATGAAAAAKEPPPIAAPEFSPRELAPADDDTEAQFALALLDAREGAIESASKALEGLVARAPAAPWPERIARERVRLAELGKLRLGYLSFLKGGGGKLAFKHKGKDVLATVAALEGGLVKLGENKLGLPSIALEEVDPYEVAKVAAKKEQLGEAQPWARFYAYALAGDARWEKLLKDDSPAAKELRADGKDYAQLGRTALAARELFELSKLSLPRGQAEAGARLERIKSLLSSYSDCGVLARRIDALRLLARSCLAEQGQQAGSTLWLHGKSRALEGGRVNLLYTFDDPREAEDWVKVPGYFQKDRNSMQKIAYTDKDSHFEVVKGVLHGVGSTGYRYVLPFIGPASVRYRFRYLEIDHTYVTPQFCFTLCETSPDSCYMNIPGGSLHVQDDKHNDWRSKSSPARPTFDWGKDWAIEFSCDGKDLFAKFEGEEYLRMPAGKLQGGYVGFIVHSELPIEIADIELEGQLDPAALARLQQDWIEKQLAALGFH